jgi:2-phosphosulfolactate phosphatase
VVLDVQFGAAAVTAADVAGKVVVVIDVLRASTTMVTALAAGARGVIPCESAEDAVQRARAFERSEVRLGGERRMQRIDGFDLGNSPSEYTAASVGGRTVMLTTTNGTQTLVACAPAEAVFVAGLVNVTATVEALRTLRRRTEPRDVLVVASGTERRVALEDAACAGRIIRGLARGLPSPVLGDGARLCLMLDRRYGAHPDRLAADASHAHALREAGFADDVEDCLALDRVPVAARYHDRMVTRYTPPARRAASGAT